MLQIHKPIGIQALVPEPADEALRVGVLDGFAGSDEIKLDAVVVCPLIQGTAGELRPIVRRYHFWQAPCLGKLV